jgi:agmatine/peptidylarginine deiminase
MKQVVVLSILMAVISSAHRDLGGRDAISKPRHHALRVVPPPLPPAVRGVLPGEFEPIERVLITWDPSLTSFYGDLLTAIEGHAEVTFVVEEWERDEILALIDDRGIARSGVSFVTGSADTIWMRDYGPLVVRGPTGLRWTVDFSYTERPLDDAVPRAITGILWPGRAVVEAPLRLENGNLLSDGRGRCVSTDFLFELESSRSRGAIRQMLANYLGCRELIVLPQLIGEPTGHVDMYVAITGPAEAIVGRFDDELDPDNAALTDRAARKLERAGFTVRRIRMPPNDDGVYRSYTNALAVNDVVLVPVYGEEYELEREALAVFASAYPGRDIVPIDSDLIIDLDGAVHCAAITIAR